MDGRRPAGRNQQRIDRDLARRTAAVARHRHRRDAQPPRRVDDRLAGQNVDAERPRLFQHRRSRRLPAIDDGGDRNTGSFQIEGRLIGRIVRRVDTDLGPDGDAVVIEIHPPRRGEHDARPVVVWKDHVPLDRAGGEDHALRPDLPKPLTRQIAGWLGDMIGDALGETDEIVVVVAEGGRTDQHFDIVHRLQPRHDLLCPAIAVLSVDPYPEIVAQCAARFRLLVAKDHPRAGLGRGQRCRKPGHAGADHQHVAMGIAAGIMVRILLRRRDAEAGGATD